jgi:hypothetical protein
MHKFNFSKTFNIVKNVTAKHSPAILTGLGIAGMITTTVLAVKATPKALDDISAEKRRIANKELKEGEDYEEANRLELTPVETVKVAWKNYIPAVVTGTVSIACIIGASSVNSKRNAALATAYSLAETSLKDYKSKVVETIGEKKEQAITDSIAKEKMEKEPVQNKEVILTGKGETLCFDVISGRYFKSDIEKIRKIINDANMRMREENYITLNEFYYELGLESIMIGDDLGWSIYQNGYIDPSFSSQLATDGTPCLVLDYLVGPVYGCKEIY